MEKLFQMGIDRIELHDAEILLEPIRDVCTMYNHNNFEARLCREFVNFFSVSWKVAAFFFFLFFGFACLFLFIFSLVMPQ